MLRTVLANVFAAVAVVMVVVSPAMAQTDPALLARGDYLVNVIGACGNCHTPREKGQPDLTKQLSGGFQTFDEPWFRVKGANLTPDPETGLGRWSDAEIKSALLEGKRPNGTPIAPIMPFPLYRSMTPRDLDAIVAYLRSVPAIKNQVQAPEYRKEAFNVPYPDAIRQATDEELKQPVKRGAYLAALGHCMACHARRSVDAPPDFKGSWGAGGREFVSPAGKVTAANISSHKEKGLGAWTDAEIKRSLTEGVSRDGRRLKPPMLEYAGYWKSLMPEDLDALVAWLRSIPPIE